MFPGQGRKREDGIGEKSKPKSWAEHIQHDLIDDLIEKIVNTIDLDEKVRWFEDLMSEGRVFEKLSGNK